MRTANDEVCVAIQIENAEALGQIDDILSVPGVDIAFVGPVDLSMSMGVERTHPLVEEAIAAVLAAAKRQGVAAGIFCFEETEAAARMKQGFRVIAVGLDSVYAYGAAKAAMDFVRANS